MKVRYFDEIFFNRLFVLYHNMFPLYVIKDKKRNILVDTGVTLFGDLFFDGIKKILKEDILNTILLTHTHYDHVGASSFLVNKFGIKEIFASQRAREILSNEKAIELIRDLNEEFLNKKEFFAREQLGFKGLSNIVALGNSSAIELDEGGIIFYNTPGHTKCSCSYFLLPERGLFLGDSSGVLERDGVFKPLFLSSYKEYVSSIKFLMSLNSQYLFLPHNKYIKGEALCRKHLSSALNSAKELKNMILSLFIKGYSQEECINVIINKKFAVQQLKGADKALRINVSGMVNVVKKEFMESIKV